MPICFWHWRATLNRAGLTASRSMLPLLTATFPYTLDELRRLATRPGFLRTALEEILHLGGDETTWQTYRGVVE